MTTVFPVGQGAGLESEHHVIRVGRTAERLSEPEFDVWSLAHHWTTVTELVTECTAADIEDAEQHVNALLSRGVLARADDATEFAHRYRLLPLFAGLGNSPDDLERFAIGVPGLEPLAIVNSTTYELWQWGWVAPSLWAHCEVLATIGERGTPGTQLAGVLDGVAELLSDFVAVLEPVS
ncbi:hypothetical protein [Kribbella sindirgiensis]|uniref:Uncharacterized protein n=1 Tax=Kribbella sindirgiensis TaxID=1124744 RepID=A0A4R0I0P2_9ACTN|nr:hypothetical protein [Kribbella sindirgiensis]TCC18639.1 hypothetical protein E0H50_38620 [Kribbella sindirgiensis]